MKRLAVFRTNLRHLEYYHQYTQLDEFLLKCHDFYLLQGIWYLEPKIFDEVIIWRLKDKKLNLNDIVFDINGRKFTQKFVNSFTECFKHPAPTISFFRGGFPEFCSVTQINPIFFGLKLYLGAGPRVLPKYGGQYDKILVEGNYDFSLAENTIPFYKTTNPYIFKPLDKEKKYDICWICDFSTMKRKGQQYFMQEIQRNDFLKSLKILHLGNNPQIGIKMCKEYGITNISFKGRVDHYTMVDFINECKFGLVTSDEKDGSPRVCTEILSTCTPLLVRRKTRLLTYYKKHGVTEFDDDNANSLIQHAMRNYQEIRNDLVKNKDKVLSIASVCSKNINLWYGIGENS